MDIVDCILSDHHEQRRLFAALDEARGDNEALAKIFDRLKNFLEAHAAAEEKLFYPALLQKGHGALDSDSAEETTEDAIDDHNKIAEAAEQASRHDVGSDAWWQCVDQARYQNSKHMAEEERQGLSDFRRHVPLEERVRLGTRFLSFEAANSGAYDRRSKDPAEYIQNAQDG